MRKSAWHNNKGDITLRAGTDKTQHSWAVIGSAWHQACYHPGTTIWINFCCCAVLCCAMLNTPSCLQLAFNDCRDGRHFSSRKQFFLCHQAMATWFHWALPGGLATALINLVQGLQYRFSPLYLQCFLRSDPRCLRGGTDILIDRFHKSHTSSLLKP